MDELAAALALHSAAGPGAPEVSPEVITFAGSKGAWLTSATRLSFSASQWSGWDGPGVATSYLCVNRDGASALLLLWVIRSGHWGLEMIGAARGLDRGRQLWGSWGRGSSICGYYC